VSDVKKNIIAIFSVFSLIVSAVSAVNYPEVTDFVIDNAGIIDDSYEARIMELAKEIEKQTTVEVAVVTIKTLEGMDIETYAVELFEKAGIGKKDLDNGLLILIAPNEQRYRIEVGYGLEGTMPDIRAREIGVNILTPNFKRGEFGKGIYDTLVTIYGYLSDNEEIVSKYHSVYVNRGSIGSTNMLYFIFMFLVFASLIGGMFGKRRHRMMFLPIFLPGFGGGFRGGGGLEEDLGDLEEDLVVEGDFQEVGKNG